MFYLYTKFASDARPKMIFQNLQESCAALDVPEWYLPRTGLIWFPASRCDSHCSRLTYTKRTGLIWFPASSSYGSHCSRLTYTKITGLIWFPASRCGSHCSRLTYRKRTGFIWFPASRCGSHCSRLSLVDLHKENWFNLVSSITLLLSL